MLLNLLARFVDVIAGLTVQCDSDVRIAGHIVPLAPNDTRLQEALLQGVRAIGGVEADPGAGEFDMLLVVGPGDAPQNALQVYGSGWWGGVSPRTIPALPDSALPYGPYAAACLAASRVFFEVRMAEPPAIRAVGYSMWHLAAAVSPTAEDVTVGLPDNLGLHAALAGCGAVGSSWLHAMWTTPGLRGSVLAADDDPDGLIESNLNRCPLFGKDDLGMQKSEAAARHFQGRGIEVEPHASKLERISERRALVISAVDLGSSRRAIQALYPAQLMQASTEDLRAEVLRCDPTSRGACIACFTRVESVASDAELRRRFLEMDRSDQAEYAGAEGLTLEEAVKWAIEGTCTYATDRLMARLRPTAPTPAAFAVGFVSVMAGTMLAAQTVRELAGDSYPFDGVRCRAVLSLLDPNARTNRVSAFQRDPQCKLCLPSSAAQRIWRRRYSEKT